MTILVTQMARKEMNDLGFTPKVEDVRGEENEIMDLYHVPMHDADSFLGILEEAQIPHYLPKNSVDI